jgi:UPF0755 protein
VALVAAGGAFGAYLWYQDAVYTPPLATATELQVVTITDGQGLLDVAASLNEIGVLKNVDALRLYLRLNSPALDIKQGRYEIPNNLNIPELIALLNSGPSHTIVSVIIPEGLRADEISERIARAFSKAESTFFSAAEFMNIVENPDNFEFSPAVQTFLNSYKPIGKPLEGFLFPDTYNLSDDASSLDIVNLLLSTLIRRLEEKGINPENSGRLSSFYEVLTMASIVEREANTLPERKQVADIFIRRMETGWQLGSDVTLLYSFKDWTLELSNAQLFDSSNPYNTRVNRGLIPTPICNPGADTILATIEPTPNNYFFFIADMNGITRFAETEAQHYQNIEQYL